MVEIVTNNNMRIVNKTCIELSMDYTNGAPTTLETNVKNNKIFFFFNW